MATVEQARAASKFAKRRMSSDPNVLGFGVTGHSGQYNVLILVTEFVEHSNSSSINGVPITYRVVGRLSQVI